MPPEKPCSGKACTRLEHALISCCSLKNIAQCRGRFKTRKAACNDILARSRS
jgi:hypothetical protein